MPKKKQTRLAVIARTKLTIKGFPDPFLIREGYTTVKNRLYNGQAFIDLTVRDGKKITFNKGVIELVQPAD